MRDYPYMRPPKLKVQPALQGKGDVASVEGGEVVVESGIAHGHVVVSCMLCDEGDDVRHVAEVGDGVGEAEVWGEGRWDVRCEV